MTRRGKKKKMRERYGALKELMMWGQNIGQKLVVPLKIEQRGDKIKEEYNG